MPAKYSGARGGDRLWPKVTLGPSCWLWTGQIDKDGYGKLRDFEQRFRRAHVYAWWLATGAWPAHGEVVGHTCDVLYEVGDRANRACVRNDEPGIHVVDGVEYRRVGHLWLGTPSANTLDRFEKGRSATGARHGTRTHPEARRQAGEKHWMRQHPERVRGEANPFARLTAAAVLEMRRLAAQGVPTREIAERFNVARPTVQGILARKSWRHI